MERLDLNGTRFPSFIGGWRLSDPSLCRDLIDFFERHPERQRPGRTGRGVDPAIKNSMDISVAPRELGDPACAPFAAYAAALYECYRDYLAQWPFLATMLKEADIDSFNIQKYGPGGHFASVHTERNSLATCHRVLAWMTYLNDVEAGGQTRFQHFDLEVTPSPGTTLIWPGEWTHAHCGNVVTRGVKYIITGWLNFPPAR